MPRMRVVTTGAAMIAHTGTRRGALSAASPAPATSRQTTSDTASTAPWPANPGTASPEITPKRPPAVRNSPMARPALARSRDRIGDVRVAVVLAPSMALRGTGWL